MRQVGRISDWNDDRGFGFVVSHEGGARIFVHIKALQVGSRRPANGDLVSYAIAVDAKGRPNAVDVRFAGQRIAQPPSARVVPRRAARATPSTLPRAVLGIVALIAAAAAAAGGRVPALVPLAYAGFSVVSYLTYWRDKDAAGAGQWRVQESTLHLLDLLGGWPGALIAQQQFRHKTSKTSFQVMFWITVLINVGAMAYVVHNGWARALTERLLGP